MEIKHILILLSNFFLSNSREIQGTPDYITDIGLNAKQLIKHHGYPYQSYTVQTDDGYLLKLQRIPYGRHNKTASNTHPVLIMPGLLSDSSIFVNMGTTGSLAFILADNGYDVWLGNYRGSTLSRRHVSLNPDVDKKKYWDFSFHEIGYYDTPALIDKILKVTKKDNLFYVGHSQGGTCYFVMLSEKPQYENKIRFGALLAPSSVSIYSFSPIIFLGLQYQQIFEDYAEKNQAYEVTPFSQELANVTIPMCSKNSPFIDLCGNIFFYLAGWTPKQLNKARIPVILSNTPSGGSLKQVLHFLQMRSGIFRNYDHGIKENLKRYGQELPPKYNFTKVTPSTGIYHGGSDSLVAPKDVQMTTSNLPNVFSKRMYDDFNHVDVIWGIDAPKSIFNDILNDMKFHN